MRKNIEKKPGILLLITLVGFPQISETIFTPSLPQIAEGYQTTMSHAQLTLSIYFFAFACGVFLWGWLSDIIGRRGAMNLGIIVYGIGSVMCYLSQTMSLLLVARFIQAIGASTGSITTQTILRESFEGQERHRLFAQISAALAFTPAIGPLIGGFTGEYYGYRAVFFVLVMMSLLVFIYSYTALPETFQPEFRQTISVLSVGKRLLKDTRVVTFCVLIGIINGVIFSYYAEAPSVFIEGYGMNQSTYGFLGIVIALAAVIGAMVSKKLLDITSAESICHIGLAVSILGSISLLAVVILMPPYELSQLIGYILSLFILLLGTGMCLPNCLSLALIDFGDVVGTAGALLSLGYYLIVSLMTFGMSYFHNGTLTVLPLYFLILLVSSYILSKRYIR